MLDNANATALISTIDCAIPEWLQECLIEVERSSVDRQQNSNGNLDTIPDQGLEQRIPDKQLICRAFEFAYVLHQGQYRKSGEPYICHPVAVAGLLRDLGGSATMIAAGFLHDVVEDTEVTAAEIEQRFGAEVRQLVEGVTKLTKFSEAFSSKTERQAENFRRMFLAMGQDIRVIVVKLADRLHNMRTLEHLPDEKRRRIALETRDIFAPLANRLGIGRFKWELEDLAFKYLEPEAYRKTQELVAEKRGDRETSLNEVAKLLQQRLERVGIDYVEVSGRPKHLWSIYQKMHRQGKEFEEIYDIAAVRLIVKTNDACYRALAVVHNLFRPIPGRFKDYIGLPKPNRYQSLHTVVFGNTGTPLEVQIRTLEMHHSAEYGIAAHWKYKETGGSNKTQLSAEEERFIWMRQMLRQVLEWQNDVKDAQEYLEGIKDNFFDEEVYVFTPKGDVISLNRDATPVDFAYRIHTEVGNHCSGARVNGRMVTLDTPLKNGDIVEILTQKNSHPSLDWLNFVVTGGAKNRIRQWYKRSNRKQNIARGREMLEKEVGKNGFEALLKSEPMQAVAERCNYHSVEDLLAALGYGEVTLNLVVNRLREIVKAQQPLAPALSVLTTGDKGGNKSFPNSQSSTIKPQHPIAGVEGLLYHRAGCCTPIPGEAIIGVVTRERGITIHRQGCQNVANVLGDRLVPVSWNPLEEGGRPHTYPVSIQIEVLDRVGVFNDILSRLRDDNINVRGAGVKTAVGRPAVIDLCIDIRDCEQLERWFTQIKKMSDILNLRRVGEVDEC